MSTITIYTTTTCAYCHAEKEYLDSKGIKYEEVVVNHQPDGPAKLLDTCGSMGVPCTHIKLDDGTEEQILGFDRVKIDRALGI